MKNGGYNVFPEAMEPIDLDHLRSAMRVIDNYLRYMAERTDFAINSIRELPKVTPADAGKVLTVNGKGEWEAASPQE